jgi:asparagine synthase (glutamine-hydrolysing)
MATGVEVRVPLIDYEMVELAARIAPDLKQRGTIGKYVFKKAMESVLPLDVIYRPKTGFGVPLRQWILGPLAPMLRDRLSPAALRKHGLFDSTAVDQLLRDNAAGRVDGGYTLLAMLCTELWAEAYL